MLRLCPIMLHRTQLTPLSTYSLLSIPLRTHTLHNECQLRQCHKMNISEATYDTQHAASCSDHADCSVMRILRQILAHGIETQRIPVVRSHLTHHGCLNLLACTARAWKPATYLGGEFQVVWPVVVRTIAECVRSTAAEIQYRWARCPSS